MTADDQQSGLAVLGTQIRLLSDRKEVLQVPHCIVVLLTCGVQWWRWHSHGLLFCAKPIQCLGTL